MPGSTSPVAWKKANKNTWKITIKQRIIVSKYWHENNLYRRAMSQNLPVNDFK